MKTSELLIAAKVVLVHDYEDYKVMADSIREKHDYYICHSILKADGSYYDQQPESVECRRARTAVMTMLPNATATYTNLALALHGQDAVFDMTSAQIQAGRHRLVDFLIAEFQAQGD